MEKQIVEEIIKELQSDKRILCSEYMHLLKPEYVVVSGYDEGYESSNNSYDPYYY